MAGKVENNLEQSDPLTGVRAVSAMVTEWLLKLLADERGVRMEDALAALGSLMGFASVAGAVATGGAGAGLNLVKDANDDTWLFGDAINGNLFERPSSAMSIVGQAVERLGGQAPDLGPIVQRAVTLIGSDDYAKPELPDQHVASASFREWVERLWPEVQAQLVAWVPAPFWPYPFAMSIEKIVEMGRGAIDPTIAGKIVAEYALPACHLDPRPFKLA